MFETERRVVASKKEAFIAQNNVEQQRLTPRIECDSSIVVS